MAGLLDLFSGDDGQQALGLLAAAGPSMQPMNLASRLALAGQTYQGIKDNALKNQLTKAQIDNFSSEIAQRDVAAQRMREGLGILSSVLGGSRSVAQPGQLGSGSFGIVPNANPMAPAQTVSGLAGATPEQIASIKAFTGTDLLEPWKIAKEGFEQKPGTYRVDATTGRPRYIANPVDGRTVDEQGRVGLMPGWIDSSVASTLSTEAPKTLLNAASSLSLRKNADGTESPVSALSENPTLQGVLQQLLGGRQNLGAPTPGASPAVVPAVGSPGRPMVTPSQQKARDADAIAILQEELKKPNLTESERAGITREIGRMQFSQGQPGFPQSSMKGAPRYGMTNEQAAQAEAEKRQQVDLAGGVATDYNAYKSKLASDVDTGYDQYRRNAMIRQLLKDYQTGLSGADARMTFASNLKNLFPGSDLARSFAEKVNGGNVGNAQELANVLSAAGLTSVIRTLDGNGRVNKAEYQALQQHAETNKTDPSALEGIMSYQDNIYRQQLAEQQALAKAEKEGKISPKTWRADYAQIRHDQTGSVVPPTPAQAQPSQPAQKTSVVNELPKMARKGARARDTATGQVMVFNGMAWVPEKK